MALSNSISIIIPTHNRIQLVKRLLKTIKKNCSEDCSIEVIVVDSSPDSSKSILKSYCEQKDVRFIDGPASVRSKRNIGAGKARNDWLLFIDSDCEASDTLISAYLKAMEKYSEMVAAAGPTRFCGKHNFFTRHIAESSLLTPFRRPAHKGKILWATTSNFLVKRKTWENLGGFRENFPFRLGGDDTEFCLRLHEAGGRIEAVPDAVCYHNWSTWKNPWSVIKRSFRWGWMQAVLLKLYPDFRRLDSPSLAVHVLLLFFFSIFLVPGGGAGYLLVAPVFLIFTVLLYGLIECISAEKKMDTLLSSLLQAAVELPFGFGKVLGSLAGFSLTGCLYRLDDSDSAMDTNFQEIVRGLWSDHLSMLLILFLVWWFIK